MPHKPGTSAAAPNAPKRKARRKAAPKRARLTATYAYAEGQHPVDVYLSGLGEASARVMGSALDSIADILSAGKLDARAIAWHELRAEHVSALRGRLQQLYAPATANRYLTAIRAVLKACWRLELVDQETIARALDVPTIKGERKPRGRAVLADELRAVFEGCAVDDNRAAGARDAAILALLYGLGLRRAEITLLDLEDYDEAAPSIRVHGKGNKERVVFLPEGAVRALGRWLEHRTFDAGPLFGHVAKTGAVRLKRISAQLVYRVVLKRQAAADLDGFTPHDLRRTFISDLLDGGVDLSTVSRQVGHANVQTTARYDRRTDRALQDAAAKVEVPFN
ncbi:MAG: site-specific integrase [Alphaproteobacteria bacterium]|jgi:integrase